MEVGDVHVNIETLRFFEELLDQVSLPASHPAFEQRAAQIVTARKELAAAIKAAENSHPHKAARDPALS
jgi:hypothetical protein